MRFVSTVYRYDSGEKKVALFRKVCILYVYIYYLLYAYDKIIST